MNQEATRYGRIVAAQSTEEQLEFIQDKRKNIERCCYLLSQLKAIQEQRLLELEELAIQYP
jgi:hypothetical protein